MAALFNFFLINLLKNRKTLMVVFAGIVPIFIMLIILIIKPLIYNGKTFFSSFFPSFVFLFYLHFLVPIISLFLGTGIIADEAEDNTLQFLLTRLKHRALIFLTKLLTYLFVGSLVMMISMLIAFTIAQLGSTEQTPNTFSFLIAAVATLILGLAVYSALFSLLGGTIRHPLIVGLLFVFGWEKIITYVPGNAQYFTIMNYLQTLYPGKSFINTPIFSVDISILTALIVLFTLTILFSSIACFLPSIREYQ